MTEDIFSSLFDIQDTRLNQLGDPLVELEETVDWSAFRRLLKQVHKKTRKSNAGARPKDVVLMFKGLVIQNLYGLSDDQLEYQIQDRRSFQRFLRLDSHQKAPDAKTFWAFRNRLSELKLVEKLFAQFSGQLNQAGFVARKGQMIDASIIPAPIQRNSRKENDQIKEGEVPEDWEAPKRRQKDTDACWTKKHGRSHYGYKNHVEVDNAHKLIRHYQTTDASVHDSQVFDELLDPDNSSADVWADSAYRSEEQEARLEEAGYRSQIQRKGCRGKPLSEREQQGNRTRSKVRSRVEHVFGAQSNLRRKAIRSIGLVRARTEIGMMNLVYNMRRLCFLERATAS